ncbi:MAG: cell division protein FtsZ, partial [Burkholderiaceae bacterium]|nr:cell division protein FtsZ [Burkholderiaceae bacterium]
KNAVGGISDIIHIPGLVNVDFEDVKTVMSEPGKAMMGTAVAGGPDRAAKAAEAAVACPLLEGIDLSGARGVLVLIAASRASFKLAESRNAMNAIKRYAAEDAHVIFGTAYDEGLGDLLRVTVIATGLSSAKARGVQTLPPMTLVHAPQQQPQALPRTGTDNLPVLNTPLAPAAAAPAAATMSAGGAGLGGVQAAPAAHSYEGLNTPSVWRANRTHAAAKVESLVNNGVDEIEIPAFLRKQAD